MEVVLARSKFIGVHCTESSGGPIPFIGFLIHHIRLQEMSPPLPSQRLFCVFYCSGDYYLFKYFLFININFYS
jgi:hypothetical protein